ncbi:MAG: tandem-95 repeat protein [Calditrichaeota bacterium]|nr:MAG: tandem-95 repeat protein [Calditrichota bacterium]MBL1205775.1 tandem-95 repeat protein [Calditrichota bacterium]NOG45603.1 tandem-95 repeat protein [Calditrichota bacterium]
MFFPIKRNAAKLSIVFIMIFLLPVVSLSQQASAEFIIDVSPSKLPSGEQSRDGIKSIFFLNQKLYVTNIWSGLQILDVSDVTKPKEVGNYTTENRSHNSFVVDNTAYLSSELLGVTILDVTNPSSIVEIGHVETDGDASYVVANSQYVYVAEETKGVNIYDVSNPASPKLKGGFDTPGWAWGLFLDGTTLYVADKGGGLIILDVSNPSNPKRLGKYSDMRYAKTVHVEDGIAYVSNGADGLWIFDVSNPAFTNLISKIDVEGYVYHVFKTGNSVFLSNETKKRIDIVNVSNPAKPVKEGDFTTDSKVYGAWKDDVYVFIAADTKSIIVRHNHPPIITKLFNMTVDEDSDLIFSAEAFDQDGDEIYFSIENKPEGSTFDEKSGVFNWRPTYDQSGVYPDIKITVHEKTVSQLTTSTTFNITANHINRAPSMPLVNDGSVAENASISFSLEEGSDPDVEDRGKLVYKSENMPEGAKFDPATRTFSWTPGFDQSGIYTVDFLIEDPLGLLMRDGSTITVSHVDRKPDLVEVEDKQVDENALITFKLEGTDLDKEDQDKLSYVAENLPTGSVFDAATATFSWTPTYDQSGEYDNILFIFKAGALSDSTALKVSVAHVNRSPVMDAIVKQTVDENQPLSFVVSGSDPDVEDAGKFVFSAQKLPEGATFDPTTLTFNWTPTFEQSGEYGEATFVVTDPSGLTDSKAVSISVNHVNRTPDLADITPKTVDENVALIFELAGSDPDIEDAEKLVYTAEGLPEGAVLEGAKFSWTPTYDQSGNYTVNFTVSDGALNVTKSAAITVSHVNRPPVLNEIAKQSVNENAALSFVVSGSDPDTEDAGKFVLSAANLPQGSTFDAATGNFSWTPTFEQSGEFKVSFTNSDPQNLNDQKEVTITVNHVNRTPIFGEQASQTTDENSALSFTLVPATDPDKEDEGKLKYSAENLPDGATFDADSRTVNWTPSFDQSGKHTITFTAADQEFSLKQSVEITVTHVNRAPEMVAIGSQSVDENSSLSISVSASDADKEDEGKLLVSVSGLPEGAAFDAASNTISWAPTYEQAGSFTGIKASVVDASGLSAETTFNITVNNVNRLPELNGPSSGDVEAGSSLSLSYSSSDADNDNLSYNLDGAPTGMSIDGGGSLSWTPGDDQVGNHSITVNVSDGTDTASTSLSVTVTAKPQPVPADTTGN